MTKRQISDTIEDIYGFEISEGIVSDITDKFIAKDRGMAKPTLINRLSNCIY